MINPAIARLLGLASPSPVNPTSPMMPGQNPINTSIASNPDFQPNQQTPAASPNLTDFPTPLLDRYRNEVTNIPDINNYMPSHGRRALAAIAGMGAGASPVGIANGQVVGFKNDPRLGLAAENEINYAPYNRAMDRYKNLTGALEKGAGIEERNLQNKLTGERILGQLDIAKAKQETADERAKTAEQREKDYKEKIDNDLKTRLAEIDRKHQDFITNQERLVAEANRKAEDWQRKFEAGQVNASNIAQYHQATLEAIKAKNEADAAVKQRDQDRKDAQAEAEAKLREAKIADLESQINNRDHPPSKEVTQESGEPNIFQRYMPGVFGTGTKTKTTVTTTKPNPNDIQVNNQPKVGDKKKFPNGKTGTWDGKGWVAD